MEKLLILSEEFEKFMDDFSKLPEDQIEDGKSNLLTAFMAGAQAQSKMDSDLIAHLRARLYRSETVAL